GPWATPPAGRRRGPRSAPRLAGAAAGWRRWSDRRPCRDPLRAPGESGARRGSGTEGLEDGSGPRSRSEAPGDGGADRRREASEAAGCGGGFEARRAVRRHGQELAAPPSGIELRKVGAVVAASALAARQGRRRHQPADLQEVAGLPRGMAMTGGEAAEL